MPFNRLNHNILGEIRPRFKLLTTVEREDVFEHLKKRLDVDSEVTGRVRSNYAVLAIPAKDIHYWSPELQVRIHEDEDDNAQTIVRCLVGPRQSVWGMFAFFYAVVGFITFFGGLYGLSQITLGESSAFIWILPVGLILIPGIWIAAKIGQTKGRDQMLHLISVLYHTLDEHGEVERVE